MTPRAYARRMPTPAITDIDHAGLRCRAYSSHRGDGAPVFVLVHGIGMSHRYNRRLHRELAAVGSVHSLDLAGFGATPRPRRQVSVEEYADLIVAALDSLGVASCVLVGHSMGTQFTLEVARRHPDRVSHLVLMGPVVDPRRRTVVQQTLALARDSLREPPSANLIVFTDYLRGGPRWYLTELEVMMGYPTEKRIVDVTCPVLVLRGADDPVAGEDWCRRLAGDATSGRMLQLAGHRHVLQHSAPRGVAAAVARFAGDEDPLPDRRPHARRLPLLRRARWWLLDYLYAGYWQVRSILPLPRPTAYRDGSKSPVVVIPGIYERWRFLSPLVRALHDAGHPVHVITLLQRNQRPVPASAALVGDYLEAEELDDVTIVAHSKGGLIGKYLMLDPRTANRVRSMVAICTPFSGSRYARFMLLPGLRSFRPGEATTTRMSRELGANERITSLFGEFDPHIPEGSVLPGARNVRLPAAGHFRILGHPRTVEAVLGAVSEKPAVSG